MSKNAVSRVKDGELVRCYTVRELLKFLAGAGVDMDAKLKIAGRDNAWVYTLTYVPDDNVLYFDPSKYRTVGIK